MLVKIYIIVSVLTGMPVNIGCDAAKFRDSGHCQIAITNMTSGTKVSASQFKCTPMTIMVR